MPKQWPELLALWLLSASVAAQDRLFAGLPTDPQGLADAIEVDLVRLRGLNFSEEISVTNQSMADFEAYLNSEMERAFPAEREAVFGRVAKKLGLYNGPVIEDAAGMIRRLTTSQVAAYYDPEASAFYVLLDNAPLSLLAPIYAHELYHGLQDQHWDLDAYLLTGMENGLNDDEILARQSVVEGEATYIMNLWTMEKATGRMPPRWIITATVLAQSMLSSSALASLAGSGIMGDALGEELAASAASLEDIPAFMIETMTGAYLKGMSFVHAIAAGGWDDVERLYEDPPQSSEQILHPEKWLERDEPVRIQFADLEHEPALDSWTLLESNVIGEFQWRIIFGEFGLGLQSVTLAAGWDGDRYAVLERGDELLLLLATTWDSEADASEFASGYSQLLESKYADTEMSVIVGQRAADVLIVEGGDRERLDDYLDLVARATRQ